MSNSEQEKKQPSKKSGSKKYFDIHGPVFWPSVFLIASLIIGTLIAGESAEQVFNSARVFITDSANWLFVAAVNIFYRFFALFCFQQVWEDPSWRPRRRTGIQYHGVVCNAL
ncbi:MAG: hypothetical protein RI575_16710 [Balneolaceae bacterium]|nr:hypothetical protein [Balneolaceae bacterium]MDR9410283.1 hypothetical protein [Balneolaceae bacterium]